MREIESKFPNYPITDVVMALYHALTPEDVMLRYEKVHYIEAYNVIKEISRVQDINEEQVEASIMRLEKIGLDTTLR